MMGLVRGESMRENIFAKALMRNFWKRLTYLTQVVYNTQRRLVTQMCLLCGLQLHHPSLIVLRISKMRRITA